LVSFRPRVPGYSMVKRASARAVKTRRRYFIFRDGEECDRFYGIAWRKQRRLLKKVYWKLCKIVWRLLEVHHQTQHTKVEIWKVRTGQLITFVVHV
jgi:hypothetical protein